MRQEINKINNIIDIKKLNEGQMEFEVTVRNKKTGEIVYQKESCSGLLCTVEGGVLHLETGEIEAVHQIFGWGALVTQYNAKTMAEEYFEKNASKIFEEIEKIKKM